MGKSIPDQFTTEDTESTETNVFLRVLSVLRGELKTHHLWLRPCRAGAPWFNLSSLPSKLAENQKVSAFSARWRGVGMPFGRILRKNPFGDKTRLASRRCRRVALPAFIRQFANPQFAHYRAALFI
jgi:hypothetical protein